MASRTLGYLSQPVVKASMKSRPHKIQNPEAIDSYWYGRQPQRKERTHMPRTASEGPANYSRVVELVEQGSKLSEAFVQVAKEALPTGTEDEITKKSKSVAANYYRVKKQESGDTTSTPRTATPRKATSATVAVQNGDVLTALGHAEAALKQAVEQVKAQNAELDQLRKFKAGVTAAVS
jgi:hypothetical protein